MGINALDAQHISTNLANYEAARSGFFTFIVDNLDNIIKATYSGEVADATDSAKYQEAQKKIELNVLRSSVPHFELEVLRYRRGNEEVKFAGVPTFNSGDLVVDDVVGLDTKGILMAWQALGYNIHTRRGGRMVNYKKDCTLVEYTQDYQQIRSWKLYGCWISGLSEDEFNRESDGKRQITATIQYDRAEMLENNTESE